MRRVRDTGRVSAAARLVWQREGPGQKGPGYQGCSLDPGSISSLEGKNRGFPQDKLATQTFLVLFVGLSFQDRVFLYSLGCPGTCSVDQAGLKLAEIHLSLPPKCSDQRRVPPQPGLLRLLNKVEE